MSRLLLRVVGAAIPFACWACAARHPSSRPVPAEERAPHEIVFASTREARATMLMLEDERRFDPLSIEAAARNPDPSVRASAAHACGSIADLRGLPLLERLAGDSDAPVRAAAGLGLEIARRAEGAPAAAALLSDPDSAVRCAAGRAAAALRTGTGETALIDAIRRDPKPCLLYALARYGNETAAQAAREFAGDRSVDLRRAAIYAFARNPVAGSSSALRGALADSDPDVAGFAARGLGVLGDPSALPALASALDRREPGVRTLALNAIGQIEEKGTAALPADRVARIVALSRDSHPSVATAALAALRWFEADREAFRAVHAQAVSGSGRRLIVAFLSEAAALKDKAKARIEEASRSPDVALRAAAASGLAFLSEEAAAPLRQGFLRDASPRVREAALNAIPCDASHRPILSAGLSDADAGVRSAAVDRLAEMGDPSVLPELQGAILASRADSIPDVALSAVRAAAKLKGDAGKSLLQAAIEWPRTVVAREARRTLAEVFPAEPALPLPSYSTGRTLADYEKILSAAHPHRAVVRTIRGSFTISLDAAAAPLTVANFDALARKRFFDGTAFDRVVPWFVIQGGDPTGTLHGGPGYEIRDELVEAGYERGSVGMGLEGADTGGSQWFVALSRQPHLDGRYPLFGKVVSGEEVVEQIEQGDGVLSVVISEAP
jgi:cyclophilin family peptidyl-prolyl cis-trans isomerase/HEAT repeat protein